MIFICAVLAIFVIIWACSCDSERVMLARIIHVTCIASLIGLALIFAAILIWLVN